MKENIKNEKKKSLKRFLNKSFKKNRKRFFIESRILKKPMKRNNISEYNKENEVKNNNKMNLHPFIAAKTCHRTRRRQ